MTRKLCIGVILQGSASWVGGAEYSRNLIKALYRLPGNLQDSFELRILAADEIDQSLYADMPPRFWSELHTNLSNTTVPLWMRLRRRLRLGRFPGGSALVRHAHRLGARVLFPLNRPASDHGQMPAAAWVPDFQHCVMPEYFRDDERRLRDQEFEDIARHAQAVIVSSQAGTRDLERFYPSAADKTHVLRFCTVAEDAWFAADPLITARQYGLPERFFIVCNQFWRHKNHRAVFAALGILKRRGITPTLVCTGKPEDHRRPGVADEIMRLIENEDIGAQVRLLGLVPRVDQVQLIRQSLALVQPSLFEGWSTVVEDCRALGKKLALSEIEVHREQNPANAVYFSPRNAEQLADILADWWRSLPAGTAAMHEGAALEANRTLVRSYGERFLKLARAIHQAA